MVERALIVPPDGSGSMAPRAVLELTNEAVDSEPPTMMDEELAPAATTDPAESTLASKVGLNHEAGREVEPSQVGREAGSGPASTPPSSVPGSQIAIRFGELAKEALLAADSAALERWADGLRATGESPAFTERMRAMARLGRGDIGDALRVLRRTRGKLDPKDHRRRCQTSLALGVALSAAGRPQEALLEGMDALARARQIDDERGAKACLAFLAKLYTSVSRDAEADLLRRGA